MKNCKTSWKSHENFFLDRSEFPNLISQRKIVREKPSKMWSARIEKILILNYEIFLLKIFFGAKWIYSENKENENFWLG